MLLMDDSNLSIIFCIWGKEDIYIPQPNSVDPVVIMIKNAKCSDFGKHSLNSNDESEITINPKLDKTHELK